MVDETTACRLTLGEQADEVFLHRVLVKIRHVQAAVALGPTHPSLCAARKHDAFFEFIDGNLGHFYRDKGNEGICDGAFGAVDDFYLSGEKGKVNEDGL